MDANEINLDELDNSDISSGWDSSEDEAPAMEVESDNPAQEQQDQEPIDYDQANDELNHMDSEDEPEAIPRTEHELSMESIEVEEFNIDNTLNMLLVRAGVISHILDGSYIVDAGKDAKALEENTILFRRNMEPIGRIMEVFGQVEHPYYVIRWPKSMENPNLAIGETLFMNNADVHFILPAQLNTVGTDASNLYDEEPSEKERMMIECTEDVKGDEVPDESGLEGVNYQQDYVIPSEAPRRRRKNHPRNQMQGQMEMQMPFQSMPTTPYQFPMPNQMQGQIPSYMSTPTQQQPQDASGLDILRNSYF